MEQSLVLDKKTVHNSLRITEIFHSLQGESSRVGLPTVFVRLTGCPLRCTYCDSEYAFYGGKKFFIDDIIEKVKSLECEYVCVTGGEPLAQRACHTLLKKLCDLGFKVSLETSGAIDVSTVDKRVLKILDLKTPGSNESDKNLYTNLEHLNETDEVKFVICSREDYIFACDTIKKYSLNNVLLSPSWQQIKPEEIAAWILEDKLKVRFQVQLHKYLWGDVEGK